MSSNRQLLKLFLRLTSAVSLLICILVFMAYCGSESAELFLRLAIGDGGVLRSIGTIHAHCGEQSFDYEAYAGKGKYTCGVNVEELILLAQQTPPINHDLFSEVLLGRDYIAFPCGLSYMKLPFGLLPMTCLGGVSCDKALNVYSLTISHDSNTNSVVLKFPAYPCDGTDHEIIFDVPLNIFNAIRKVGG